mmetsp:Transcript_14430/g.31667  ORF Transcript_14430/g.31667 Transcript_14430/m.31667 type:complete len:229 (-) Transcript_14430:1440-2126(-)
MAAGESFCGTGRSGKASTSESAASITSAETASPSPPASSATGRRDSSASVSRHIARRWSRRRVSMHLRIVARASCTVSCARASPSCSTDAPWRASGARSSKTTSRDPRGASRAPAAAARWSSGARVSGFPYFSSPGRKPSHSTASASSATFPSLSTSTVDPFSRAARWSQRNASPSSSGSGTAAKAPAGTSSLSRRCSCSCFAVPPSRSSGGRTSSVPLSVVSPLSTR